MRYWHWQLLVRVHWWVTRYINVNVPFLVFRIFTLCVYRWRNAKWHLGSQENITDTPGSHWLSPGSHWLEHTPLPLRDGIQYLDKNMSFSLFIDMYDQRLVECPLIALASVYLVRNTSQYPHRTGSYSLLIAYINSVQVKSSVSSTHCNSWGPDQAVVYT